MFFSKNKPTVTPEDKEWIENEFLWFEDQYGQEYLRKVKFIEPTLEFFDYQFSNSENDVAFLIDRLTGYMDIKNVRIDFQIFDEKPFEFEDEGIIITQSDEDNSYNDSYNLGTFSEKSPNHYLIEIESSLLNNTEALVSTIAHELSHLILLGENRIAENDELLTDLNCIALGLGIFMCNSIFSFQQWQGYSHHGWSAQRSGYIPEEVATYALALMSNYSKQDDKWDKFLNKRVKKMYDRNMSFITSNLDIIGFK